MKKLVLVALEAALFSPVYMVRILGHLQTLSTASSVVFQVYVLPDEDVAARQALPEACLLWCSRAQSESSAGLFALAREHGVPILYDVDDMVWRLPAYSGSTEDAGRMDALLRQASLVSTPSSRLSAWLSQRFPQVDTEIVPNSGDLLLPDEEVAHVPMLMANSDFFRLPAAVQPFFESVERVAREMGKLIVLYYFSNDVPIWETDRRHLQVIWMGFRSYANYRRLLHILRPWFGLVVLPEDPFSPYKSVIKFAEFAFSGVIGLYSDTEPYRSYVRHGVDGFLMKNTTAGFQEALRWALGLSGPERAAVLQGCRTRAQEEFSERDVAARWAAVLQRVASTRVLRSEVQARIPDLHDVHPRQGAYFHVASVIAEAKARVGPPGKSLLARLRWMLRRCP